MSRCVRVRDERTAGLPRAWIAAAGKIAGFTSNVVRNVWGLRVLSFFGEALRQAGILIVGSTLIIWGLVFITGLGTCGIEGAYFLESQGAPSYAGVFTALCDLREAVPYTFGYMMSAKVGTGIVAELGAMRISDEIDALEVMGFDSMAFLCGTRLLASWIVMPFMYISAIGVAYLASYIAVVLADRIHLSRGLSIDLLGVPKSAGPAVQPDQGNDDGHRDRAGGLLLRLQRQRRPRRGGRGHGEVDGVEPGPGHADRNARDAGLLGHQPALPGRGVGGHPLHVDVIARRRSRTASLVSQHG